jgi:hypothetical protein
MDPPSIGQIYRILLIDKHICKSHELTGAFSFAPNGEEILTVFIEFLDTVVPGVEDIDISLAIESDSQNIIELKIRAFIGSQLEIAL